MQIWVCQRIHSTKFQQPSSAWIENPFQAVLPHQTIVWSGCSLAVLPHFPLFSPVFSCLLLDTVCVCSVAQSHLTLCGLCTVAHQAPLTIRCSSQRYWSGLSFPPPGDLANPGTELASPAVSFPLSYHGSPSLSFLQTPGAWKGVHFRGTMYRFWLILVENILLLLFSH